MLECLPCRDSETMAEDRRAELRIPMAVAAQRAWSTVRALKNGGYPSKSGGFVDWSTDVAAAVASKISIPPDRELPESNGRRSDITRVQVANETTLGAARRLGGRPLALNFANGIKAGGGFLIGARAQEEALCRSSALYATLRGDPMYKAHRRHFFQDSTAWAILSPNVPVYLDDRGEPLDQPWSLAFLTCAAPLAHRVRQPRAGDLLQERIHRILAIAQAYHYDSLVLGAWGCGAFGNDPVRTARDFRQALEGSFDGIFAEVVFAIADWSPNRKFLGPFRDAFTGPSLPVP